MSDAAERAAGLEATLRQSLAWAVFEPNTAETWARARETMEHVLHREWRRGLLRGTEPQDAYFVRCDRTTMTQTDLDNGTLVCVVGLAPVKSAEFVIIRIGQSTAQPASDGTPRKHDVMEFAGVGREAFKGLDVDKYIRDMRDEWDDREETTKE